MCLPKFQRFEQVSESTPLTGYRTWKNKIKDSLILTSEYRDYDWSEIEGPHEIKDADSGIYAYNNYYNYYYYNYYYNYNCYNNYNYYNNNNYNYNCYNFVSGIISQWGRVAIHFEGQRSEYAKIDKLFTIRRIDAEGPKAFLDWIDIFNQRIAEIASKYKCSMINWQDFKEQASPDKNR